MNMTQLEAFHDIRFPTDLAFGATGGPQRRTEIVTLGTGKEQRNTRWTHSRRRYNVGYGIKTIEDLQTVIAFFEERRGRFFGFRFRDPLDWKSCKPSQTVSPLDQQIGIGDGTTTRFSLVKRYGTGDSAYQRVISKPVPSTLRIAVNGSEVNASEFTFDTVTMEIGFVGGDPPASGHMVTAGYEFDVPVRFDTDEISVNLAHFEAGDIPVIPLMELL